MTNPVGASLTTSATLLRRALQVDAVVSGATGLLLTAAAGPLADLLGLHVDLLRFAGLSLLPFAILLAWLAARPTVPRRMVWAVIAYNLLWAVDSILLLTTGWVSPTTLGMLFVAGQALIVAGLAELQWFGLRRAT